jgi:hypothetical protein
MPELAGFLHMGMSIVNLCCQREKFVFTKIRYDSRMILTQRLWCRYYCSGFPWTARGAIISFISFGKDFYYEKTI